MKRVTKIWLVAVILFTVPVIAQADAPFVNISPMSDSLKFGEPVFSEPSLIAPGAALYPAVFATSSAALTLEVESNCLHGPIMASITELKHSRGKIITPDRISIKAPITDGYVSMAKPVLISNPEIGPHNIDLNFRLEVNPFEIAGRYEGNITFTIMPLP
ncbi:MAG: hypothetical protein HQ580_03040 [Planctomycetes bacterium]|nr:hypothetical protein [Planctomycetota bacterium]